MSMIETLIEIAIWFTSISLISIGLLYAFKTNDVVLGMLSAILGFVSLIYLQACETNYTLCEHIKELNDKQ